MPVLALAYQPEDHEGDGHGDDHPAHLAANVADGGGVIGDQIQVDAGGGVQGLRDGALNFHVQSQSGGADGGDSGLDAGLHAGEEALLGHGLSQIGALGGHVELADVELGHDAVPPMS